ncbi:MAG: hypothetical protein H7X70_01265, partial [Candidatus Kapabacteria bacterium]|nr:hypothetical protein [Candidatus Kapabacteria bacterium]
MNTRLLSQILSAVLAVAMIASCQNPTQPTDLTASRTLTLEVRTSANDALSNVTIDWMKFTGVNAPIGSVARTGEDGFAQFVVPDVSTSRDSIRMTLTMPPASPFASMGPIVVETSVCSDTLISVAVAPETPCGTLNLADTIVLEACPQAGSAFVNECRIYPTSCPGGVVFTSATTTSGSISVALRSFGNASSAVEVCATYQPPTSTPPGQSESFLVVVEGRSSGSPTVQVRLNLLVIGRTTCEPCPCPTFATGKFTTETVCVGDNLDVLVPLDSLFAPIISSADCITEFSLVAGTNDVFTVSSGSSFFVRSGQRFPTIDLAIDAVSTGQIKTTLEYEVRTRNLVTGVETTCPDRLKIELTTNVVTSACTISRNSLDTLQK